jgi:hypothetical protein
VEVELFHADGRTDITRLTVAFRNLVNTPNKMTPNPNGLYWVFLSFFLSVFAGKRQLCGLQPQRANSTHSCIALQQLTPMSIPLISQHSNSLSGYLSSLQDYSTCNNATHLSHSAYYVTGHRAVSTYRRLFQITDEYQRHFQMYTEQKAFVSPSGEEFNISAPVYNTLNKENAYVFS